MSERPAPNPYNEDDELWTQAPIDGIQQISAYVDSLGPLPYAEQLVKVAEKYGDYQARDWANRHGNPGAR